jgi:hypothetical protein
VVTTAAGRRAQVATSRYSNPNIATSGLVPIGITRYPPRFKLGYKLRATLYDFAPTAEMLQLAKQPDGRDRFTEAYLGRLETIGPASILAQLEAMQGKASGVVLLCYEDVTDNEAWCHRLLLGHWLRQHAGLDVRELPDPGKASRLRAHRSSADSRRLGDAASPTAGGRPGATGDSPLIN